ncbi:MAG: endonuclease/exonuclease/phosphatase family protein [Proteobacteria bacterium]|nr:endonuclease/exonuclease/phosphatase family protein [Pseudomonadota bacterium]
MLASVMTVSCVTAESKAQTHSDASAASEQLRSCDEVLSADKKSIEGIGESRDGRGISGLNPDSIAFLNWNLYKGDGDNWQSDFDNFAGSHDVLIIQEAFLDDELDQLLSAHAFAWQMNTAFYLNGTAAGVMTAANSGAVSSCGFQTTEPIIRVPKSTLVSYYRIDGHEQNLLVANIHGINFTLGMDSYQQQLDDLYAAVKDHRGPMIIAGDFNSWSDERMSAVNRLKNRLLLHALEYSVNNKTHVFGNAIDHVFYRQLEPIEKKVWQVTSSDHNPISVRFRLADAPVRTAQNEPL